ncbi:MAG: hypothetical protein HZC12_06740 [Nitrospirae bacterium]|nr:hypothetical protein [Nitrospirota bacterium]
MKKILILLLAVTFSYTTYSFAKERDKIEELRREITLLNLINGLNLTDSQSEEILKYVKEAKAIRDSTEREYDLMKGRLNAAFAELRDSLYDKNTRPTQEVERQAAELNRRVKEKKEETLRQLREIEGKTRSVLTPGQIEIVQSFRPCLIPPKDLNNPVRAGQAFDSSPAERLLERIRSIPEKRYATAKYRIADEYIKRLESHIGGMAESEKDAKIAVLLETLYKARKMSDEEFALNKRELALQINPKKERAELKKRFYLERSRKGIGPVGRFLLDEKAITILEKRLEASKGQGSTGNMGLSDIDEDSKGRTCALRYK